MSVREVTMYKVVCDMSGCTIETSDCGDYTAWGDAASAVDDWTDSEKQATGDGKHFCTQHRIPECCGCDSTIIVVNDDPPTNGDWYCYSCASSEGLLGTPETAVAL